ncbi:MAG TPA: hypothetical protein VM029_04270 [Opitutaceae bacterium]|nr:hypothetical protein [Opitutaceae bacterium]
MTQRVFVAILTVVVFLAGYSTRMLTDRGQPVPPPPAALTRELATSPRAPGEKGKGDVDRAKIVAEIQKLRPQIEGYTTAVQEIYADFDREFAQILTAPQRDKFVLNQKKRADSAAKRSANRAPLSDEEIMRERDRPLTDIYRMVTVTTSLEWMTKEYGLDANQQASVRQLLALRRNKFVALFDATPHPYIRLSRLASMIERVTPAQK